MNDKSRQTNAAKYLLQLCSSTQYSCNSDKLSVLVLLAHFACLVENRHGLIDNEYICADATGLHLASLKDITPIHNTGYHDKIQQIDDVCKLPQTDFKPLFRYDEEIINDAENILRQTFLSFGAYPAETLDEITTQMSIYPKINFYAFPGGSLLLPQQAVNEYVNRLILAYDEYPDGVDIIRSLVSDALQAINEKKGTK